MALDLFLTTDKGELFWGSLSDKYKPELTAAGLYDTLYDPPKGTTADDLILPLMSAKLTPEPARFVRRLLQACRDYPQATVTVSV